MNSYNYSSMPVCCQICARKYINTCEHILTLMSASAYKWFDWVKVDEFQNKWFVDFLYKGQSIPEVNKPFRRNNQYHAVAALKYLTAFTAVD